MRDTTPTVICIPAKPEVVLASKHQLRVAAYCRVSTDDEEQLTSYEAQKNYYTDKIMTNKEWTMAGIFADEGITGTSARKRPEFLRMIRQCKQGKIDIVLTKSISRFARNTVDCLNYVRALKELGIAVIFEKENMNTLEIDSEILITMLGAFAQSESESISANVRWGIRQAMKEGKATIEQGIVCSVVITGTVNDGVNLAGDHLLSYLAIGAERARTVNVELYGAAGLLVQLRCDTFKSSGNRVTCGKVMCKLDGYDIARIGRADCVGGAVGMLCSAVGAAASCEDRHAEHDAKK